MISKIRNLLKKIRSKKIETEETSSEQNNALESSTLKTTKRSANIPHSLKRSFKKIAWAKIPQNFFDENKKATYHKVFQVSILVLIVGIVGKFSGLILTGKKDYKKMKVDNFQVDHKRVLKKDHIAEIKASQIFKTVIVESKKPLSEEPKEDKNITCSESDRKSSLSLKLVNTIVLQDSKKSLASIKIGSQLQEFREGESMQNKARLDKIERLRLIIKNEQTGQCEFIQSEEYARERTDQNPIAVLSPKKSKVFKKALKKIDGIENDGNKFKIKRDYLKNKMNDISSILTQARGIQINNPDGSISFKIVDIEPGGMFAYLGMENGDIITGINGEPINNLNDVMNLFGKVTNLSNLNLTLKRGGEEVTQDYSIK